MADKFFITRTPAKANHAGSKAVNDTDTILENEGYQRIGIYPQRTGNKIIRKIKNLSSLNNLNKITEGSFVVVEHPMYISRRYIEAVKKAKEKKSLKLAFLIHDFETVRNLFPDNMEIREIEKIVLQIADIIIVHNDKMKKLFTDKFGFDESRIVSLYLFDYLCDGEIKTHASERNVITVAGNLNPTKSGYIYRLKEQKQDIIFNLYGVNYEASDDEKNIRYNGSVDATLLPNVLDGRFGLVWDGNSADSCEGATGEYMKINNPHKTSLYLASGIPVIVWKEAAVADFVTENKVGLTVSSLSEISDAISKISDEEYEKMLENVRTIGMKERQGGFFKDALRRAAELADRI